MRLLFFGDYKADPVWDATRGGMVDLDSLPISDAVKADARDWNRRWERLAEADMHASGLAGGMKADPAEPVSREAWRVLERDGRAVWRRLRAELGASYQLGWLRADAMVEWAPGSPPVPR